MHVLLNCKLLFKLQLLSNDWRSFVEMNPPTRNRANLKIYNCIILLIVNLVCPGMSVTYKIVCINCHNDVMLEINVLIYLLIVNN